MSDKASLIEKLRLQEKEDDVGEGWKVLFTSRPTQFSSWEVSDLHSFSLPARVSNREKSCTM
jgi:hypothetical protein